jgi:hypothetical protein
LVVATADQIPFGPENEALNWTGMRIVSRWPETAKLAPEASSKASSKSWVEPVPADGETEMASG